MIKQHQNALNEREQWRHKVNNSVLLANTTIFSIVISLNLLQDGYTYPLLYKLGVFANGLSLVLQILVLCMTMQFHDRVVKSTRTAIKQHQSYVSVDINTFLPFVQNASYALSILMIVLYTAFAMLK